MIYRGPRPNCPCPPFSHSRVQIQKEVIFDLKRKKPVFVQIEMRVCMIDLSREIYKPVLKLDFTAHDLMLPLSELQLRSWICDTQED